MRQLPPVSTQFGAPMGRQEGRSAQPTAPVEVLRMPLDDGGYDSGGAYWGLPNNLFRVEDGDEFCTYLRAQSKADAIEQFKKAYPDAEVRTDTYDTDAFVDGYLECAVWSTEFGITEGVWTKGEFSEAAVAKAEEDCTKFIEANRRLLVGIDESSAGHDFWLTRNHHGAGFWDRQKLTQEQRDGLTKASHAFPECSVVIDFENQELVLE